jgi:hypothetical protein
MARPIATRPARRLPFNLPSRAYAPSEEARWIELHAALIDLRQRIGTLGTADEADARLERLNELQSERDGLSSNSLLMALTVNGPDAENPVFLHPQVLADYGLVQELVAVLIATRGSAARFGAGAKRSVELQLITSARSPSRPRIGLRWPPRAQSKAQGHANLSSTGYCFYD